MKQFITQILIFFNFFLVEKALASYTELGEAETFSDLVSIFWAWAAKIIIGISVVTLIVGAIFYITSSGNDEKMDDAKQIMSGSIIATVIVMMSGIFKKLLEAPAESLETGQAGLRDMPQIIQNVSFILLGTVASLSLLMLVFNSFKYLTSMGDIDKMEKAKNGFKFASAGLLIALFSYLIINIVIKIFI